MTSSASRHLNLDIETYSTEDLPSVGAYKYAAAPGFRVLLCGYAWDGGPVHLCDLTRDALPDDVAQALTDPSVAKHAFNAAFERVCLSAHLGLPEGTYLDPRQWRCTMVAAAYWGASGSLKQVGGFLGVEMRKDAAGTRLINKFSKPQARPVPREGEDWERFKAYCIRDVECEMEIASKLPDPLPAQEQLAYVIDQRINDRGVLVDGELARQRGPARQARAGPHHRACEPQLPRPAPRMAAGARLPGRELRQGRPGGRGGARRLRRAGPRGHRAAPVLGDELDQEVRRGRRRPRL